MTDSKSSKEAAPKIGGWRVWVSWFVVLLFTAEVLAALFMPPRDKTFAVSEFAKILGRFCALIDIVRRLEQREGERLVSTRRAQREGDFFSPHRDELRLRQARFDARSELRAHLALIITPQTFRHRFVRRPTGRNPSTE